MSNNGFSRFKGPCWRYGERLWSKVPPRLRPWVFGSDSLTRRLQLACDHDFRVELINQRWARPFYDEIDVLGMKYGEFALIRQVKLYCHNEPRVFARTVIPRTSLVGNARRLSRLGNRSLGSILFADKSIHRGKMEVAALVAGQRLFQMASSNVDQIPAEIWGRRSIFSMSGKPLLVSEIFLPGMEELEY